MPPCAAPAGRTMSDAVADRDDSALLSAIAGNRDHAAFEELCARHSRRAYNIALHFLGNAALADDAVQEALLAVWLSAGSYSAGHPEAWIMSIVVKKSLHLARVQ
jgi:RNA polymerase sigma-70 factor, ECF subfamily